MFRVLGSLEALDGERPVALGAGRPRTLLLMLLAAANRTVTDDRLTDGLWPDGPPPSARKNLQVYVHQLRRALDDPSRIVRDGTGYRLTAATEEIDALRFEDLVVRARESGDPRRRGALLAEALGLWRGAAYSGQGDPAYSGRGDPAWLQDEALRLDELRLTAVEEHVEAELALGRHERLIPELRALVRGQPLRERPAAQLMVALYRAGRRAEALQVYQDARTRLASELGLDPSPALRAAHRAVLTGDPALDLAEVPAETPPWRGPRSPVAEVIGRDPVVADLVRTVRTRRLVTVTGPGGVGKTTVALRVAARAAPSGGVAVLALAHLSREDDVLAELAALLDVGGHGEAAWRGVEERLRDGERLLVLDNCEHLAEPCARLVARLVPACPGLRILVTGRRPLGVPGEVVRPLAPLEVPAADEVTDAVRLFARRAAEAAPGVDLDAAPGAAGRVCRAVDGLPLALELAAARLRAFGPAELADRLEDDLGLLSAGGSAAEPRHRTLTATIDWSYRLLDDPARTLLARLSVFHDGFTADAARQVCAGPDLPDRRVPALLATLVDDSLVQPYRTGDAPRFRLLETVRDYARDRLDERGETGALRDRHLAYWLDRARAVHARPPDEQIEGLRALAPEVGNLRAALGHGHTAGRAAQAVELTHMLGLFWVLEVTHLGEFERWTSRAAASAPPPMRPAIAYTRATMHIWRGEFAEAAGLLRANLADLPRSCPTGHGDAPITLMECLFRTADPSALTGYQAILDGLDPRDLAEGRTRAAGGLTEWGRPDLAVPLLDRFDATADGTGAPVMARVVAVRTRCLLALERGDLDEARRWEDRLRDRHALRGPATHPQRLAWTVALRLLAEGAPDAARRELDAAIAALDAAYPGGYAATFPLRALLAESLRRLGRPDEARPHLARALAGAARGSNHLSALTGVVIAALTATDLGDPSGRDLARDWNALRAPAGLAAPLGLSAQVKDVLSIDPAARPPDPSAPWTPDMVTALTRRARTWAAGPPGTR
ncbi:BTAD domain-containing putative transcriptional regulator [Actinomadura rupiterrae]|uniref:BTAD domain-containing putative transcriptional regulator n=1 Tax=Actinomadura rupiterrae TaxID=559627 RepID=UPI0020A5B0C5|nr:BTAD domain-containing putative transcriptional regulator [Actinomadura rupiterrae]